jgi:hypothetical protein
MDLKWGVLSNFKDMDEIGEAFLIHHFSFLSQLSACRAYLIIN